jgi:hypothetical protein
MRFMEVRQPDTDYILVPSVSSGTRKYIPIGFVAFDIIVNNTVHIIPGGTFYHFGILTSIVHMAWVRCVCGRLKSDYRYSKDIVYNNFIWPDPTDKDKNEIIMAAKKVIDTRKLFPENSLADLYDPLAMPEELLKAHQNLDRAVIIAYKLNVKIPTEETILAKLLERYQRIIKNQRQ